MTEAFQLDKLPPPGYLDERIKLLVDTTCYGVPGLNWCTFLHQSWGSAAAYPIKVRVPGRGVGQYRLTEIKGQRIAQESA